MIWLIAHPVTGPIFAVPPPPVAPLEARLYICAWDITISRLGPRDGVPSTGESR